jgi:hypothetical protein
MSPKPVTVENFSVPNVKWGVCGFASALAALWTDNKINTTLYQEDLKTRLLAEIKSYLRILQGEGSPYLLHSIQSFTQTFKGFEKFTIEGYIQDIDKIVSGGVVAGHNYGIAMPAEAVIDYLKRTGMSKARMEPVDPRKSRVILGFGTRDNTSWYRGLKHWVYKFSGTQVYNFGAPEQLSSVQAQYPDIVYQIAF